MQHDSYAGDLLAEEMGSEGMTDFMDRNNFHAPYEVLHSRGWVRVRGLLKGKIEILGRRIDRTKIMRNTINPAMNNKQMSVAKNICRDNGVDFSDAINDSRFH